jgi:hypothetical protein
MDGSISASNRAEGGAYFEILLPDPPGFRMAPDSPALRRSSVIAKEALGGSWILQYRGTLHLTVSRPISSAAFHSAAVTHLPLRLIYEPRITARALSRIARIVVPAFMRTRVEA